MTREEAIDVLKHNYPSACFTDLCEAVEIAIKALSVQPERKKGKWKDGKVKHIHTGELRNMRECSECGSSYFVYDNYNSVDEIPNYCPNCGADMRKEVTK